MYGFGDEDKGLLRDGAAAIIRAASRPVDMLYERLDEDNPSEPVPGGPYDVSTDTYMGTAPLVRGQSPKQAVYDVARVMRKAAETNPTAHAPLTKWMARVNYEAWADANKAGASSESAGKVVPRWMRGRYSDAVLTEEGRIVASEDRQKSIANTMAAVYAEGAEDLRVAGVPRWAAVLDGGRSQAETAAEQAEEASLQSGLEDAADRAKTTVKIGVPLVLVGVVAYLFLTGSRR
jgi:hypothetical protein